MHLRTLHGEPPPHGHPSIAEADAALASLDRAGAWPVLHLTTDGAAPSASMITKSFPAARAIQFNDARWDVRPAIDHPHPAKILAWSSPADAGNVWQMAGRIARSARASCSASFVIWDESRGQGIEIDPEATGALICAWASCVPYRNGLNPRITIAGGLGPDAETLLRDAASACPIEALKQVSLDAESRCRGPSPGNVSRSRVDPQSAEGFVRLAAAFVSGRL